MTSYNELILSIRNQLKSIGIEEYSVEARYIVAKSAGKSVSELMRDLRLYTSSEIVNRANEFTARRLAGEPLAYILGEWEFYGLDFYVTPDVLIPRMDTEVLVKAAKEILTGRKMDARILDLCCGSGCISCALAKELPAAKFLDVDISNAALEVCRRNIARNRLSSRMICMQADATVSPPAAIGQFDMIVCNPPYISSEEIPTLDTSVKDFEPIWALDGGPDGLKFYKAIIKYWKSVLAVNGQLVFEVGEGQADAVSEMLLSSGAKSVKRWKDTLETDRVIAGLY